ncbi:glucans biosynthesis glucosyltransferase MdoH [Pinisolibacter sp. B13]|nr:glucans biosynthesis glucosyltransferase MdoH [Pinisolibacter aquiterrae]MBV5264528.1 glucans biosynthesis glucosyltransferase MdoH [Pinisolibacter aquiterrae]MCC8235696.1 glucans biosynthesis glucosyltransferase MdoH [Pinisolibacter aquiterrae]
MRNDPVTTDASLTSPAAVLAPVPPEAPMAMPVQKLDVWNGRPPTEVDRPTGVVTRLVRLFVFGLGFLISAYGVREMVGVVSAGGIVGLEWPLILFFGLTFSWIALSAASGIAGFFAGFFERRPKNLDRPLDAMTALVMPVYNESPARTIGALEAMAEEIIALGEGRHFEIFVCSDTTDQTAWVEEELAIDRLRHRLGDRMAVWYRRRHKNVARKAGNIQDFVTRWGDRYDHMLVLDADSLMMGTTIVTLARLMEDDAKAGIIQTLPVIVNRNTLFARLQQFAGSIYGPVIARGLAVWHGRDGNYWGHNAIIRTKAFAEACGLPDLPGRKPFGGHVMSHDFVEAALIRRGGWAVYMVPWLAGSYEESPPSLLDVAMRDRRWAQGNLQHMALLGTRGLVWPSRVHFSTGIMSYLASPIWLMLLLVGLALALQARFIRPEYFSKEFSLYPAWPRFDSERAVSLFLVTMGVLLLPKVLGVIESLIRGNVRRRSGGAIAIVVGMVLETLISALVAPVMMLLQSRHVAEILLGRDSGWKTQRRDDGGIPLAEVIRHHWQHATIGVVMTFAAYVISPAILAWMSPTVIGLMLAVPISWASGSLAAGLALKKIHLLLIPEETDPPAILAAARAAQQLAEAELPEVEDGLTSVVENPVARAVHARMHLPPPLRARGKPELEPVMAAAKIHEATNFAEVLSWLGPKERMAVLCEPELIKSIDRLIVTPEPPPNLVALEERRVQPYPAEVPPQAHEFVGESETETTPETSPTGG